MQSRCIVLAPCHSAVKRRGLLPFGGRFVAEIFVQNFKWRVSQRGADVSCILIQLLLLYLKNLLSYTAWHNYFQALIAVQILPSHICIMRVYTMPLYCTCSVSQRAIRRGLLPFGGRFVAEIFVQNLKWRVSQRGADVSYILIQLLLLYLKNLLSYTDWHNYFQAFIAVQILPSHICIMRVYTMPLYCTCSVSQRAIRRGLLPFGGRFVAEIFVQNLKWRVSQRGADVSYILIQLLLLYLKNLLSYTAWHNYFQAFIAVQILPSHICIKRVYTMPLYCTCSVSQRAIRRGLLPFGGRFVAEIFVQNLKWRVSQRGADVSYILIQLLLLYLKNLLSYTDWHNYFQAFIAVQILPSHICIMRVYTMPLYCTCSVSQRAIRRGLLPFGVRFVAEIFVQNFKWRVSQRVADVSYILIQLLLLYLKNLLSYTDWHNYFQAFIAVQILPSHICIMRVYAIPLYCTCSVSQRCKKTRATSLRRPFCSRNIRPKFQMTGVSERGRRKLYFDPTFITVSQKLAELYSLT